MAKILVADDETDLEILIKQKFRKQIRENQYEFIFAINGHEALEKIQQNPDVDIVLSDINMPVMDGLTLLTKLSELSPLIKSVIVSAYGDMENIRTAMNRGAFDFLTKPINFDDLELTMKKTIHHVAQLRETLKAIKENNILRMYVDETVLKFMNRREYESSLMLNETVEPGALVAAMGSVPESAMMSVARGLPVNDRVIDSECTAVVATLVVLPLKPGGRETLV